MGLHDELHVYRKRRVLYLLIGLVSLVLIARLYQLQLIYSDEYGKKSEENSIRIIPREPVRGLLFDRNGVLVVDNRPAFTVTIMPFEFDRRAVPSLASLLALDPAELTARLARGEAYSRFAPVKIQRDIDFKTLSALEEMRDALAGVSYQIESKRFYATAARASHLFGYTKEISEGQLAQFGEGYMQGDVVGSTGLEAQYEGSLRGAKGAEFSTVNVHGQVVGSFENGRQDLPAVDGKDLLLTLDADLQAFAESLMTDRAGAVVAIDPADGGILAFVSKPDYDLGIFSGVTSPELWKSLNADPAHPLFNRATLTRYPPGSTFKMILALAALENNVMSPGARIHCTGAFRLGNKVFKDLHVHGSTDMAESIQRSCNVYYYQLMLKVGLDAWSEMGSRFGFGKLTGMDILEESPGLLPSTAYMNRRYGAQGWTRGYLPSLGIGQGELGVTPLQMALYAMVLANRGAYHQPHTVRAIVDRQRNTIDTVLFQTRMLKISPRSWDVVREGMRRVVEEQGGTGGMARIKGIESAGKTGTAQNPHGDDHAWYVGFAPFDSPRIAMAVLVENVGYGGSFAAPVAGKCIERYLLRTLPPGDPGREKITDPARTPRPIAAAEGNR
jgi:penicillin-binding protein 2